MSDTQQLVIFSLAREEYALPITSSAPWIRGVINLRGKIVPVCDLAMRLGLAHERSENAKIAVVETEGGTAGVVVDSVEEVLTVATDQIEAIASADSEYVDGVAKLDRRLPILLNPDGLLAGVSLAA
jgi:purine-binding chemotaxis protein CheW